MLYVCESHNGCFYCPGLSYPKERSENESESAWLSRSMSYTTEQFGLFGPDIIPR